MLPLSDRYYGNGAARHTARARLQRERLEGCWPGRVAAWKRQREVAETLLGDKDRYM
jgi:hypothetical protein